MEGGGEWREWGEGEGRTFVLTTSPSRLHRERPRQPRFVSLPFRLPLQSSDQPLMGIAPLYRIASLLHHFFLFSFSLPFFFVSFFREGSWRGGGGVGVWGWRGGACMLTSRPLQPRGREQK